MNKWVAVSAVLLVAVAASAGASVYLGVSTPEASAEKAALDYIRAAPTFAYDGVTLTLKATGFQILKSNPPQYAVSVEFTCTHSGYGDRSGKFLLQVLTPHKAQVIISSSGAVTSAEIDGYWDELKQKQVAQLEVESIAVAWIEAAPTFKYDGVVGSIKVRFSVLAETFAAPAFWIVDAEFDCRHAGYGDRTGMVLAQVITRHTIRIHVTEGKVTLAVIDNVWDEISQKPTAQLEVERVAVDWLKSAPTYKFDGMPETFKVTSAWQAQTFAPPAFWEVVVEFDCRHAGYGDRTNMVLAQVITHHSARIHVTDNGNVDFAIIDEKWDELHQKQAPGTHTAYEAEQTALEFLENCPTFRFDGVEETVKVLKVDALPALDRYEVSIAFTCAYPGYGDRTGHVTYGHSQGHVIKIIMENGLVASASIDGVWDEIHQILNVDAVKT